MIWICTIFLLIVAAWLFFNALNEMRWVQAHSHDETVAADQGFLPSFSAKTGSGLLDENGKLSIYQEDSSFARAVAKVQEKTTRLGDKFVESKVIAARRNRSESGSESSDDDTTLFARAVARVSEKGERMDQKIVEQMKSAARSRHQSSEAGAESLIDRTARKVASTSNDVSQRVAHRAKNMAQGICDGHSADGKNSVLGAMAGKVSGGIEKFESRSTAKAQNTQDLVEKTSSKIGDKINQLDK